MKTLRERFCEDFEGKVLSTKEALFWYQNNKANPTVKATYSNLYQLIIQPLMMEGLLIKVTVGMYRLNKPLESKEPTEDKWDEYVAGRLKEV